MAGGLTGAIGFLAAAFPVAWLSLFGNDPKMIETGASYLHIVGPFYGFFGGGLALYFASKSAGRVGWAMMVVVLRVIIAAGGGWLAVRVAGGSTGLFVALAVALFVRPCQCRRGRRRGLVHRAQDETSPGGAASPLRMTT
jgi:Na+-driven multidrug efflux pump